MIFFILSIKIYFFYTPDCPDCIYVKENIIKKLEDKFEIQYLKVDDPNNMKILMELERKKNDYDNKIPVVYVGDSLFGSKEEIVIGLFTYLEILKELEDTDVSEQSKIRITKLKNPVKILYFYTPNCKVCERMEYELKVLEKELEGLIIEYYDITKNFDFLYRIEKELNIENNKLLKVPVVILNDKHFFKEDIHNLKESILKVQEYGNENFYEVYKKEYKINELFALLKAGSTILAGIIDGINPCAFATLIFILSLFSLSGKRKEVFLSGLGFIISVYITYLLIGLGIFNFIRGLSFFKPISHFFYLLSCFVAILLGVLNIVDIIRIRKNKEVIVKMPVLFKKILRSYSKSIYSNTIIIFSSLLIGFIVTLFEFICTGQIYFPFITYLAQNPYLRLFGIRALIIYNIGFIFPIIVVFLLYLFGIKEVELSKYLSKRLILLKFFTATILFLLGIFIFFSYVK